MNNELEWKVVTDPEELFRLKKAGWEIEREWTSEYGWTTWLGTAWDCSNTYRARQPKPKMKQVKLLAYLGNTSLQYVREDRLQYVREDSPFYQGINWTHQPHLDLIAEVPE